MKLALGRAAMMLALAVAWGSATAAGSDERISELVSTRCSTCHGPTGQSSNVDFPKLAGQNADYLVRQMFNFQTRKRKSPEMEKEMAGLTGNDIEGLAQYFSRQKLVPAARQDPALDEVGRNIYMTGSPERGIPACLVCHGAKGRGARLLPRVAGQHARYLAVQLRRFAEQSRTTDQMLMHSVASKMTEDEIRAVSHFLSSYD